MKINDIRKEATTEVLDYTVRVSCMTYEYVKEHLEESDAFYVLSDTHGNLSLNIDWDDTTRVSVREMLEYDDDLELTLHDSDDFNESIIYDILIDHKFKILVLI